MKKSYLLLLSLLIIVVTVSCGHSTFTRARGWGIRMSWTGSSYVPDVSLGYFDNETAVIRGNTAISSSTLTDVGVLGATTAGGSTVSTLNITASTQFNEGNIRDVLINSNLDSEAKKELVKQLFKEGLVPKAEPSMIRSDSKMISMGKSEYISPITDTTYYTNDSSIDSKDMLYILDDVKEVINESNTLTDSKLQALDSKYQNVLYTL